MKALRVCLPGGPDPLFMSSVVLSKCAVTIYVYVSNRLKGVCPVVDKLGSAQTAAEADNVDQLKVIFDSAGKTVCGGEDLDNLTTLHFAAASGSLNAVHFLLSDEVGADVDAARVNNFTPLHAAAMNGHSDICRVLLEKGASPNVQTDPQGYVPLHSAAWAGHIEVIEVLLGAGARDDLRNYRGETPAQTALRQGNSAAAQRLGAEGIADGKQ